MTTLYILDRLVLKPVKIETTLDVTLPPKTWIAYKDEENNEAIGTVLGYETEANKK